MNIMSKDRRPAKSASPRRPVRNAVAGPLSLPETSVRGRIVRIDDDGFGIVEFDDNVGDAQLGFFTSKTEMVRCPKKLKIGSTVTSVIEAVDTRIPDHAGPLTLPLKKIEFVA